MLEFERNFAFVFAVVYLFFSLKEMYAELFQVYRTSPKASKVKQTAIAFIVNVVSCGKCLTFWFALIMTKDFVFAAISSALYDLYEKIKMKLW